MTCATWPSRRLRRKIKALGPFALAGLQQGPPLSSGGDGLFAVRSSRYRHPKSGGANLSTKPLGPRRATTEANAWFRILSSASVSTEDIWMFSAWFRDCANRDAYDRVEARNRRSKVSSPFSKPELLASLLGRPDLATAYREAFIVEGRLASLPGVAQETAARAEEDPVSAEAAFRGEPAPG